ncbi:MAG: outer membrane beta-barrel protein [Gammaproteobacteria bacterium]|nr:outer membrane beta-barrel protein [Gammaproteobacteria bacterium]
MNIKRSMALGLCSLVGCSFAYADGILSESVHNWRAVVGAGGGPVIPSNVGQSHNFPVTEPGASQFFDYVNQSSSQTQGMFEVFLGGEHQLPSGWIVQPGISYSQAGSYEAKGLLTQGLDLPSANQFGYNYWITTRQLMAQAKLMHACHERFYPYFLLGLGGSFNAVSNYQTTVPDALISTRQYANNTSGSFSYRVGAGVDVDVYSHTRVGVAYRFSDPAAVNLGQATIGGVNVPGTLSQSHLYVNEVMFQLTYLM